MMKSANWCFYLFSVAILFMWQQTTAHGKRLNHQNLQGIIFLRSDCAKPAEDGPVRCASLGYVYHYSVQLGKCRRTEYGGCYATRNNFPTLEYCQRVAEPICNGVYEDRSQEE